MLNQFVTKLRNPTPMLMALVATTAGHPINPIVPLHMGLTARNERRLTKKR